MQTVSALLADVEHLTQLEAHVAASNEQVLHVVGAVAVICAALHAAVDERVVEHGAVALRYSLQLPRQGSDVSVPETRKDVEGGT